MRQYQSLSSVPPKLVRLVGSVVLIFCTFNPSIFRYPSTDDPRALHHAALDRRGILSFH